jgi:predicted metal-dependent phosphoesterase TrpH
MADVAALDTGRVLPIPGVEVTMRHGHMLALGVDALIDWWVGRAGRTIDDVLRDIHAAGGVAIIAHPGADPSPICHGCRWEEDADPRQVDAVEVWNSPWQLDED